MNKMIEIIETYEAQALQLGDLDTAIRLNWLANSAKFDGICMDDVVERLLQMTINGK